MTYTGNRMDCIVCVDLTLEKLQLLVSKSDFLGDDHGLTKLKVELRLVKIFLLCSWRLAHSVSSLQDFVRQNGKQVYSLLLLSLKDGLPSSDLAAAVSGFCESLKNFRQEIHEAYVAMLDSLLKSFSASEVQWNFATVWSYGHTLYPLDRYWYSEIESYSLNQKYGSHSRDEFMELFHSLLENLADIIIWDEAYDSRLATLLEPLQEKLVFLKNFILFARRQGKSERKLMKHCGVMALSAARLCYVCWFFRDDNEVFDGMGVKISELIEEIKPVYHHVRLAYTGILESGSTSLTLSTKKEDMFILGNFVDSLLGNLWKLLQNCPTYFMVSVKHQLRILNEGLQFLRNLIKKQQEKYDVLNGSRPATEAWLWRGNKVP